MINKKIILSALGIMVISLLGFSIFEKSNTPTNTQNSKIIASPPKPIKPSPDCSKSPVVSLGITGDRYEAKEKNITITHGQSILYVIKADAIHTLFLTNETKKSKNLIGVNGYCSIYSLPGTYYFTVDDAITTTINVK